MFYRVFFFGFIMFQHHYNARSVWLLCACRNALYVFIFVSMRNVMEYGFGLHIKYTLGKKESIYPCTVLLCGYVWDAYTVYTTIQHYIRTKYFWKNGFFLHLINLIQQPKIILHIWSLSTFKFLYPSGNV